MHGQSVRRLPGRSVGRQGQVKRQEYHPIISIGPNEIIGQAYYRPVTATDTDYKMFFVKAFDLLYALRMQRNL